jgi:homoserine acetyltransferase
MFGNGFSSSPNNSTKNQFGAKFPTITLWDNIYCQHKLITEKLKIKKIALVTGWSMAWLSVLSMGSTISKYGESYSSLLCLI